jgi:surface antigen
MTGVRKRVADSGRRKHAGAHREVGAPEEGNDRGNAAAKAPRDGNRSRGTHEEVRFVFVSIKALSSGTHSLRMLRGAIVLAGVLGLSVLAVQLAPSQAHAAGGLHYQRGHYLTNGWYCYGWSNGAYHCTQHWHRSGGRIISDNPGWVPNGGSAVVTTAARGKTSPVSSRQMSGPNRYPWGQCTWYARSRGGAQLNGLGNAKDWFRNAQRRGLPSGYTPRVGATVVLQPGVHGTSYLGHVGHVEKVYGNGSFLMSDMNWGGFGRVTYHVMQMGRGISFIY